MVSKGESVLEEGSALVTLPKDYSSVLEIISGKIRAAQTRAMVAVNNELVGVYRDIGQTIYEQQKRAEWGIL